MDGLSHYSSLCNSGSRIFWSYNEYDHDSIYVLISTDWGEYWNGRGVNVAYLAGTPQPMEVRASGNDVHLVWVHETLQRVNNQGREYIHSSIGCYLGCLDVLSYWQHRHDLCYAEKCLFIESKSRK